MINAQLIADQFAANGYFVVMPDLFHGDPIPLNRPGDFDIQRWLKGEYAEKKIPHLPPTVDPIIDTCLVSMRTEHNCKKIGAVGYCFGAKYVIRHLRPEFGKIDVGFVAHPSFVDEAELMDIKGPLAIAAAETDEIFPKEKRHRSEEILKEMGAIYQINLYSGMHSEFFLVHRGHVVKRYVLTTFPGVSHGFAVRGDPAKQVERYAKETAFLQALQWFEEYLK
jgi:dienelactone hydrolase